MGDPPKIIMTILCRQLIIRRSKLTRNLILGIESSCDDTGAAIIDPNTKNVLAESLLKQSHSRLGGVIPTVAMKRHAQALPKVVVALAKSSIHLCIRASTSTLGAR